MKKVKLMLLSLSVFAVVGGALAFKAKTTGEFCTAAYTGSCPNFCPSDRFLTLNVGDVICTAPTNGTDDPCAGVHCQASTSAQFEF